MYVLDFAPNADDIQFHFTQGTTDFGTINETANISVANLKTIGWLGCLKQDADQGVSGHLDEAKAHQVFGLTGTGEQPPHILLQAAGGSSDVYVSGIITSGTTPTYAADDMRLIFHIEYID